jgi:nicotinamidase/pyrazinamidase
MPSHGYDRATALLVVDVQNDFADPSGSLSVRGGMEIVPLVNEESRDAAAAGAWVVYTQDWHPEHTPHFQQDGGIWPVHCVHDTWGAELVPGLDVVQGAGLVRKGDDGRDGYSAFSVRDPVTGRVGATELEAQLRSRGIEQVVVVGLATDYCVKETALDALAKGFQVTVVRRCARAVDLEPGDGDRALATVMAAGARVE